MEHITCESCGRVLQVPEELFGQMVECPLCQKSFQANPPTAFKARPPAPMIRPAAQPPDLQGDEFADTDRWGEERSESAYRDRTPHRGSSVLVFGILSLVLCGPIFGPIAWIMGSNDLKAMAAGRMDRTGEGLTRAGQILGIVSTILSCIAVCFYGFFIVLVLSQRR